METSANLKSQVTRMGKVTYSTLKKKFIQITSSRSRCSPKYWYYWKIVEEFRLKCTKFKQVDQLVRENSSLTLVKGGHVWLKLSKMLYSRMYCLFLFIRSISFQKQAPTKVFRIVVTWAFTIELWDIECALCHVTGVQFDKKNCPYKSAILDFLQKNQLLLGRGPKQAASFRFCFLLHT